MPGFTFILILTGTGLLLGLIFSKKGQEKEGMIKGAKKGAKLGCSLLVIATFLLIALIAFFAMEFL